MSRCSSSNVGVISVRLGEEKNGGSISIENLTAKVTIQRNDTFVFEALIGHYLWVVFDKMKEATGKIIFLVYGCCPNHTVKFGKILQMFLDNREEEDTKVILVYPDLPLITAEEGIELLSELEDEDEEEVGQKSEQQPLFNP